MANKFSYTPKGVCTRNIEIEVNDGILTQVSFTGGCNGNLKGIKSLVSGMKAEEVIAKLKGIECGARGTSCPDQLAKALESIL